MVGWLTYTVASAITKKLFSFNTENKKISDVISEASARENVENYIVSTSSNYGTASFDQDRGYCDEINPKGVSSQYTFYASTSGGNGPNVKSVYRKSLGNIVNDVVVYGKGSLSSGNISRRASHCTNKRTKILNDNDGGTPVRNYGCDAVLSENLSFDAEYLPLANACPSIWGTGADSAYAYVLVGKEIMRVTANFTGITPTVERARRNTQAYNHKKGAGVKLIMVTATEADVPEVDDAADGFYPDMYPINTDGFTCSFNLYVDSTDGFPILGGLVWVGEELMKFDTIDEDGVGEYLSIVGRGSEVSRIYAHSCGSPVVLFKIDSTGTIYALNNPEEDSSVEVYGIHSKTISINGTIHPSDLDKAAEIIIQNQSFTKEEVQIDVPAVMDFYGNNASSFQYLTTKNLNPIGCKVSVYDTNTMGGTSTYRITKEDFSFDKRMGFSLILTGNNTVPASYASSSNIVGKAIASAFSFIDMLKEDIGNKSQETAREANYQGNNFMQMDDSGGSVNVNSKFIFPSEGIVISPSSDSPTPVPTPTKGAIYYNPTTDLMYFYNGSSWVSMSTTCYWTLNDSFLTPVTAGVGVELTGATDGPSFVSVNSSNEEVSLRIDSDGDASLDSDGDMLIGSASGSNIILDLDGGESGAETWCYTSLGTDNEYSSFRVLNNSATTIFEVNGGDVLIGGQSILGKDGANFLGKIPDGSNIVGEGSQDAGVWGLIDTFITYAFGDGNGEIANILDDTQAQTVGGIKTFTSDIILDDGSGDSPTLIFINGNDNQLNIQLKSDGVAQFTTTYDSFEFISSGNFTVYLPDNGGVYYSAIYDSDDELVFSVFSDGAIITGVKSPLTHLVYTNTTNNMTTFKKISGEATESSTTQYYTVYDNDSTNGCQLVNFVAFGAALVNVKVTVDGASAVEATSITQSTYSSNSSSTPDYEDSNDDSIYMFTLPPITAQSTLKIEVKIENSNHKVCWYGYVLEG